MNEKLKKMLETILDVHRQSEDMSENTKKMLETIEAILDAYRHYPSKDCDG